jgi:hypothetical protein
MKILLLHPKDDFPLPHSESWDLVVDFGRAPAATYERWRRQSGCPVVSLYDFAEEIQDLNVARDLLQLGAGSVVDSCGIDWWSVLSVEILPQLQQLILVHRLAKTLDRGCALYSSRAYSPAAVLQKLLGAEMTIREGRFQSAVRRLRHYHGSFSRLDSSQLAQVLEDKFDGEHFIRRRFALRGPGSDRPVILLPSAYSNVSRAALAYADLIPDHEFLLVLTRRSAKPRSMPANVRLESLTPHFAATDRREITRLLESWDRLRKRLVRDAEEFKSAEETGALARIPSLLRWGFALRDAWNQIFELHNVTACLCGDDSNPLSSVPLILGKKRGLPALARHHGALDCQMAIKTNHADFYLAKNEMERDYLGRICRLASEKIVVTDSGTSSALPLEPPSRRVAPWLVFFTEPYESFGWRADEVYRELLPRLYSLAHEMGLKLVFKIHPLESVKGQRSMLRRFIPEQERQIDVIAGPPTAQLWSNARFALTVQSSTAVECAALDIPVFLFAWLRDPYSGYVSQYARFGIGHVLESPERIAEIPQLLEAMGKHSLRTQTETGARHREQLMDLFSGARSLPMASHG